MLVVWAFAGSCRLLVRTCGSAAEEMKYRGARRTKEGGAQHWQTVCQNGKVSKSNHDSLRKIIQYLVLLGINTSHNGISLLSFSDRVDRQNEILFVCVNGGCGGGCRRVNEVPRVRLEKGASLSTKGSRAHLDSGGWTGLWAGQRRCSHSFGEWRVWWWMWAGG